MLHLVLLWYTENCIQDLIFSVRLKPFTLQMVYELLEYGAIETYSVPLS